MNGKRKRELRPVLDEAVRYGAAVDRGVAKASKAFKYAHFAHAGYKLASGAINSFLEKKKEMAPTSRQSRSRTPSRRAMSMDAPKTPQLAGVKRSRQLTIGSRRSRSRTPAPRLRRSVQFTGSKSAGKFEKGTNNVHDLDKYAQAGVVIAREFGDIQKTTGIEKAQSIMIGHSLFHANQLRNDIAVALTKMVFTKMQHQIRDFADVIVTNTGITMKLTWIRYVGDSSGASSSANFTATSTYNDVVAWFRNNFTQLENGWPDIMYDQLIVTSQDQGAVKGTDLLKLNLAKCKFDVYVKSSLKIQNRTVSSSGNDEEDDVDNVPLYGKSYSGNGNWALFGNLAGGQVMCTGSNLSASPPYVVKNWTVSQSGVEPVSKAFTTKVKLVGKAHLDPGNIKTSVLTLQKKFGLTTLLKQLIKSDTGVENGQERLRLGKYQFIILEKMIQSVATTDVNAIQLAYEVDHKVGIQCSCPKVTQTNYIVFDNPT